MIIINQVIICVNLLNVYTVSLIAVQLSLFYDVKFIYKDFKIIVS